MFKNYLISSLRNIKSHKWYSMITLAGLSIGMTCFILITLYIKYEFSYDRFHKNAENTYRILVDTQESYRGKSQVTVTPGPLATAMIDEFPEVLSTVKVTASSREMRYKDNLFTENRVYYADPTFLEIFDFPLVAGDKKTALIEPNCVLLSKDMSEKYFNVENPIGKTIHVGTEDYRITGVLKNIPGNTHFRFDFLASFTSLVKLRGKDNIYRWNSWSYQTYILLHQQADPLSLEKKLPVFLKKNYREDATQTLRLQPVSDIHFHTKANFEIEANADIRNVYLLSAIGLFILLIACFNYMNLSTARATTRAKEIGMRKVIGASRGQLLKQFLGESILFSSIALVFSIIAVRLLMPAFRIFIDRNLETGFILDWSLLVTLIGLVLFVGLVSGIYPSLVLSSFQPVMVIKGTRLRNSKGSSVFRNSLVVSQFAISVALIFCTVVVYRQLHFMKNKELGFVKDYVLTVRNPETDTEAFESELRRNSQILDVAASDELPINIQSAGFGEWEGYNPEEELVIYRNWIDANFLDFYNISIVQGRGFAEEYNDEEGHAYILNQAAVSAIGWEKPIGKRFGFGEDETGIVVGVVKDFHFAPLYLQIEPLAFTALSKRAYWLSIRIHSQNVPEILSFVERTWKKFSPEGTFSYTFLDDRLDRMYRTEQKLGKTFSIYTFIALFVACLGLFGLASFTTDKRKKEIGIRKVLGATEWNIAFLTTKKFVGLVLLSNSLAWPIAYFVMNEWLQHFAYRMSIGFWIFIFTAALSVLIALLTVGYQSVKVSIANPVDSLRYE